MHTRSVAALALSVALAPSVLAQTEFVVSEYTLGGSEVVRYANAGVDSDLANYAVQMGPGGDVYVVRDGLSSPSSNLGDVIRYTRAGSEVSSVNFGAVNASDRRLTGLDFDSAGNMYVSARNGIGPIGTAATRGSIFRVAAVGGAITTLQPFGFAPDYNDVSISNDDRIYASAWRGSFTGDDQMVETNQFGANLNSFSNTGNSVYHLDLDVSPTHDNVVALTANNGDSSTGRGWKIFSPGGATFNTINLGGIDDYEFVGLELDDQATLWTYNRATESVERYMLSGTLLESYSIPGVNNFLTDFTMTPDGNAIFSYRVNVPAPASGALATLAGVVLTSRRRR